MRTKRVRRPKKTAHRAVSRKSGTAKPRRPRQPRLAEQSWIDGSGQEVSAYAFTANDTCVVDPRSSEEGFYPVNPLAYYGITEAETRALDRKNLKLLGYIPRLVDDDCFTNPPKGALAKLGPYSYGGYTLNYDVRKRHVVITRVNSKFRQTRPTFGKAEEYIDALIGAKRPVYEDGSPSTASTASAGSAQP